MAEDVTERLAEDQGTAGLGLALSGGGFRASFFHLGTLAALAERDMLRYVEVISTVSGGSIIGALYYLRLRALLQRKHDRCAVDVPAAERLACEDYEQLVAGIARDFLAAVQTNIRLRVFASLRDNMRMRHPSYSRSDRIAELYDELFYRDAAGSGPRPRLRDLRIAPRGGPEPFVPDRYNAGRGDKVPALLINATALNTGRNWRFEARTMGEPPPRPDSWFETVSTNAHLARPPCWEDVAAHQRDFSLGAAVAASAAVPLVFPPLAVSGLYPDGTRVQLVDGGVHDNQGIAALEARGCSAVVVSDASGQLPDRRAPDSSGPAVMRRANAILMARVREEQLVRLYGRLGAERVMYLSLRSGLAAGELPYIGGEGHEPKAAPTTTAYGIDREVQERLSRVRTDLDSFSDREAHALMADGYAIAVQEAVDFGPRWGDAGEDVPAAEAAGLPASPRFRAALAAIRDPQTDPALLPQLAAAERQLFRILFLRKWLWLPLAAVVLALLWGAAPLLWPLLQLPLWPLVAILALPLAGWGLNAVGERFRRLRPLADLPRYVRGVLLGTLGALLLSWLTTLWRRSFDRWLLAIGRLPANGGGRASE